MSDENPCFPEDPLVDQGRANSPSLNAPKVCPIAIPNNTGLPTFIDGVLVFQLGPGIGSAEGGGPDCPIVPPPPVQFVTEAENLGTGTGLYIQTVNGVMELRTLEAGSNISFAIVGNNLVISSSGGLASVAWDDVTDKPVAFSPSAHAASHTDGSDDVQDATAAQKGLATATQITKLDGIEAAATSGATWGSNITSQPAVVDQAEAEAGTATTERIWTAQRVAQAIAALAGGGSGTVTNTGGNLTANAVVLGAGTVDTKVVAGVTTDGTAQLVLGVNATTLGSVKMFGNTSGDVTIAPNAVAGTAVALTLPAASGTIARLSDISGGGSLTIARWTALDNQPPAANFATLDTRNSIAVLDFDADADESAVFVGIMPEGAVITGGVSVIIKWMATSATSGAVVWEASLERCNTDLDADSFDTIAFASGNANGTSGIPTSTAISLTTIDSVAAGDLFRLKISRDANGTNGTDDATGDAELIAVELRGVA